MGLLEALRGQIRVQADIGGKLIGGWWVRGRRRAEKLWLGVGRPNLVASSGTQMRAACAELANS